MKHQRLTGLQSLRVRRAYLAMFADSFEYNEDHLRFLADRSARYIQSLR